MTASRPDHDHDAVCTNAAAHRVVVAPPGTGKTHLAVRLAGTLAAELSDSPVPNTTTGARVLLLTFSNQARAQLEREAARQLDHSTRRRVVVSNYHSLFWSAVRSHRRALGLPERLQIVGTQQREQALSAAEPDTTRALRRHPGLLESLAEHEFEAFHDDRTPPPEQLAALLAAVTAEQHAGRLVFDDFGALFWRLLERFPTLATSYRARFPIVIADEHQDASALQDAVVRRLATQIKVILADPLQLIHGFRGARDERLDAHITEARHKFELRTPHRWHNQPDAGKWLLGVRERLLGDSVTTARPDAVQVILTPAQQGLDGAKFAARKAVSEALSAGATRVAVLTRSNTDAAQIRSYLCRQGFFPRESAGASDFDATRSDIELLSASPDGPTLAGHALDRIASLVPGLTNTVVTQIKGRLEIVGVRLKGAGTNARPLLEKLAVLYDDGPRAYFTTVTAALDACRNAGHHIPRQRALRPLLDTAAMAVAGVPLPDLLDAYAERAARAATHTSGHDDPDGLYVMTVHQSKGKEFDAMVLLPASKRWFPADDEGRRLLYVAITRARSRWALISPANDPSPLLTEIGLID